jgi:hypothetical protein
LSTPRAEARRGPRDRLGPAQCDVAEFPDHLLTLPFSARDRGQEIRQFERRPLDAVALDDLTTVAAAAICQDLGLRANPIGAVSATGTSSGCGAAG